MPAATNDLLLFSQLFTENQSQFVRFAWSYVRDEPAAEDIVMEALMAYWEKRHQISSEINPSAYILTTIKNKCLNYLRHIQISTEVMGQMTSHSEWELSNRIATLEACEPNELFVDEVQQIIGDVLAGLSEITARVFVLSRYEDKSQKEIAELMGMTVKGVEYHVGKATKALRVALKDYLVYFPFLYKFLS